MNKFEVKLASRDGHTFIFSTVCETEQEAIKRAFTRLDENGYSLYSYKLKEVRIV